MNKYHCDFKGLQFNFLFKTVKVVLKKYSGALLWFDWLFLLALIVTRYWQCYNTVSGVPLGPGDGVLQEM